MLEIIPTWSGEKEEVELYFTSQSSKVKYEKIFNEVTIAVAARGGVREGEMGEGNQRVKKRKK